MKLSTAFNVKLN